MAFIFGSFYFRHYINFVAKISDTKIIYYTVSNIISLIILVLSIYHSNNFKKMVVLLNTYKSYFPTDQIYFNNLGQSKKILMYYFILHNVIKLSGYMCFYAFDFNLKLESIYVYVYFLCEANTYICYQRILCEFPVIYSFLFLIAEQINCITRSVNKQIEEPKQSKVDQKLRSKIIIELQLFDKWSATYATVGKISKLYNVIFGLQVILLILRIN